MVEVAQVCERLKGTKEQKKRAKADGGEQNNANGQSIPCLGYWYVCI